MKESNLIPLRPHDKHAELESWSNLSICIQCPLSSSRLRWTSIGWIELMTHDDPTSINYHQAALYTQRMKGDIRWPTPPSRKGAVHWCHWVTFHRLTRYTKFHCKLVWKQIASILETTLKHTSHLVPSTNNSKNMQTHQKTALGNLANTAAYTGRRKVNCAKFSAIEWGRNNAMLSCFQAAHGGGTTICCQRSRFAGWSWSDCLSECWAAMQFLEWEEGRVEQSWEMLSIWLMRDICVRISGQLDPWLT